MLATHGLYPMTEKLHFVIDKVVGRPPHSAASIFATTAPRSFKKSSSIHQT